MSRRIRHIKKIPKVLKAIDIVQLCENIRGNKNSIEFIDAYCGGEFHCQTIVNFASWSWGITDKKKIHFCCQALGRKQENYIENRREQLKKYISAIKPVKHINVTPFAIRYLVSAIRRDAELDIENVRIQCKIETFPDNKCIGKINFKGNDYGITADLKVRACCLDYNEGISYGKEKDIEKKFKEYAKKEKIKF